MRRYDRPKEPTVQLRIGLIRIDPLSQSHLAQTMAPRRAERIVLALGQTRRVRTKEDWFFDLFIYYHSRQTMFGAGYVNPPYSWK